MLSQPRDPAWKVNPFAVPSNTGFRFFIFVLLIVGSTVQTSKLLVYLPNYISGIGVNQGKASTCILAWGLKWQRALEEQPLSELNTSDAFGEAADCLRLQPFSYAVAILASLGFVGLVALLIFALKPWWFRWRGSMQPLTSDRHPALQEALRDVERNAKLPSAPSYVWQPLANDFPYVFAGVGPIHIYLSGKFAAGYAASSFDFRAILLHEFAHIQNRDVRIAFLTEALWWAFAVVVIAPFALSYALALYLSPEQWQSSVVGFAQVAIIAGLAYLFRCAILRAREFEADLQAARDPRVAESLIDRLHSRDGSDHGVLRTAISTHPPNDMRIAAIQNPSLLFRAGPGEFFGVSFALAQFSGVPISMYSVALQHGWFDLNMVMFFFSIVSPLLLYTCLTLMTFGIAVSRARFPALADDGVNFRTLRLALAAAVGVVVGFAAIPVAGEIYLGLQIVNNPFENLILRLDLTTTVLLHFLVLTAYFSMFAFLFHWMRGASDAWLPVIASIDRLKSARLVGAVLLTTGAISLCFVPVAFLFLDFAAKSFMQFVSAEALAGMLFFPFVLFPSNPANAVPILMAGLILLAASPVLWFRHGMLGHWVMLAPPSDAPYPSLKAPPLRLRRAIAVGLTVGLLSAFLLPSLADQGAQVALIKRLIEPAMSIRAVAIMPAETWARFIWTMMTYVLISGSGMLIAALICPFMGTAHGVVAGALALVTALGVTRLHWDLLLVPLGFSMSFFAVLPVLLLISIVKVALSARLR